MKVLDCYLQHGNRPIDARRLLFTAWKLSESHFLTEAFVEIYQSKPIYTVSTIIVKIEHWDPAPPWLLQLGLRN